MRFGIRTLLILVACVALLCVAYVSLVVPIRQQAQSKSCSNNLRQVGLALLNYESAHGALPLAVETSPDGSLYRSWRTHVYPHYMEQSPSVYDSSTAWDSTTNLRLLNGTPIPITDKGGRNAGLFTSARFPDLLCCPCAKTLGVNGISYVVITGDGTAFPKSRSVKSADITDGLENTILVVESISCNPDWTEPKDLELSEMSFTLNSIAKPAISSHHPNGANVCFADGRAYFMSSSVSETELRALLTIAGGESITRDQLAERGILKPN